MMPERPVDPQADVSSLELEEMVDGVPVLAAEVRALEPVRRRDLPVVQAAAVAATSFVAGAATIAVVGHRLRTRKPRAGSRKRGAAGETLAVLGTRSFLLDVHLLGRAE